MLSLRALAALLCGFASVAGACSGLHHTIDPASSLLSGGAVFAAALHRDAADAWGGLSGTPWAASADSKAKEWKRMVRNRAEENAAVVLAAGTRPPGLTPGAAIYVTLDGEVGPVRKGRTLPALVHRAVFPAGAKAADVATSLAGRCDTELRLKRDHTLDCGPGCVACGGGHSGRTWVGVVQRSRDVLVVALYYATPDESKGRRSHAAWTLGQVAVEASQGRVRMTPALDTFQRSTSGLHVYVRYEGLARNFAAVDQLASLAHLYRVAPSKREVALLGNYGLIDRSARFMDNMGSQLEDSTFSVGSQGLGLRFVGTAKAGVQLVRGAKVAIPPITAHGTRALDLAAGGMDTRKGGSLPSQWRGFGPRDYRECGFMCALAGLARPGDFGRWLASSAGVGPLDGITSLRLAIDRGPGADAKVNLGIVAVMKDVAALNRAKAAILGTKGKISVSAVPGQPTWLAVGVGRDASKLLAPGASGAKPSTLELSIWTEQLGRLGRSRSGEPKTVGKPLRVAFRQQGAVVTVTAGRMSATDRQLGPPPVTPKAFVPLSDPKPRVAGAKCLAELSKIVEPPRAEHTTRAFVRTAGARSKEAQRLVACAKDNSPWQLPAWERRLHWLAGLDALWRNEFTTAAPLLKAACARGQITACGYNRFPRVSLSVADLAQIPFAGDYSARAGMGERVVVRGGELFWADRLRCTKAQLKKPRLRCFEKALATHVAKQKRGKSSSRWGHRLAYELEASTPMDTVLRILRAAEKHGFTESRLAVGTVGGWLAQVDFAPDFTPETLYDPLPARLPLPKRLGTATIERTGRFEQRKTASELADIRREKEFLEDDEYDEDDEDDDAEARAEKADELFSTADCWLLFVARRDGGVTMTRNGQPTVKSVDLAGAVRWAMAIGGRASYCEGIIAGEAATSWERVAQLAVAVAAVRVKPPRTDAELKTVPLRCGWGKPPHCRNYRALVRLRALGVIQK